jgi:hypothetical protein
MTMATAANLIIAIRNGNLVGVNSAIRNGEDVNTVLNNPSTSSTVGWWSLYIATGLIGYAVTRAFTDSTKDSMDTAQQDTVLHYAIRRLRGGIGSDSSKIVLFLIASGAKVDVKNGHWELPADIIPTNYEDAETMRTILTAGPDAAAKLLKQIVEVAAKTAVLHV